VFRRKRAGEQAYVAFDARGAARPDACDGHRPKSFREESAYSV
jgi:hypothetical protein